MPQVLDYMTPQPRPASPWLMRAAFGLALYPLAMVGSLYLTWAVGRLCLGHWPRPSLDDPKYISSWVDIPYNLTMLMMLIAPGIAVIHLMTAILTVARRRWNWVCVAIVILLPAAWYSAFVFLRWDPLRVGEWFID